MGVSCSYGQNVEMGWYLIRGIPFSVIIFYSHQPPWLLMSFPLNKQEQSNLNVNQEHFGLFDPCLEFYKRKT